MNTTTVPAPTETSIDLQSYPKSRQEAFDRVWTYFVAEGHAAGYEGGGCRYRTKDGCRCGIGVMIPDSVVDEELFRARHRAKYLDRKYLDGLPEICGVEFLEDVQYAHDEAAYVASEGKEEFKPAIDRRLRRVAGRFNVTIPTEGAHQ